MRIAILLLAMFVGLSAVAARAQSLSDLASCRGCFVGEMLLAANPADPSGDTKLLVQDLYFIDAGGVVWKAGKGDITDGASIPALFQPIVGGPWENDYLPAAVMHDHYTNDAHKVRKWQDTDEMFYQAMLVNHVDVVKAKTMYYAVYTFGPHWDDLGEGVDCGPNCTFMQDIQKNVRPADYSLTHSAELIAIEDEIRASELNGKPLSLDDLKALALEHHSTDAFVAPDATR